MYLLGFDSSANFLLVPTEYDPTHNYIFPITRDKQEGRPFYGMISIKLKLQNVKVPEKVKLPVRDSSF